MKKIVSFLFVILLTNSILGQTKQINGNFSISKQLSVCMLGDSKFASNPAIDKCLLEQIEFEDGAKTVIVNFTSEFLESTPDIIEQKKKDKNYKLYFSISGMDVSLTHIIENGIEGYIATRNNKPVFALVLTPTEKGKVWGISIFNNEKIINYECQKGISIKELENYIKSLGIYGTLKFKEKENGLYVHSLLLLDTKDRYNSSTGAKESVFTHKEYGRYYFSSDDKLVKWVFYW